MSPHNTYFEQVSLETVKKALRVSGRHEAEVGQEPLEKAAPGQHRRIPITVLLADDNDCIRRAIARLLQGVPDIQILAEASSLAQTLDLASRLHPQVIVLDPDMGDECSVIRAEVKSAFRGSQLVAISIWDDDETKSLAKTLGATALLDKVDLATALIPAIRSSATGSKWD